MDQEKESRKLPSRTTRSTGKKNVLKSSKKEPGSQPKRKPSKKENRYYSLSGELAVSTARVAIKSEGRATLETPEMVIDGKGNAFGKAAIEAEIDGKKSLIILEARQVELILKLLGIAPYEQKKASN